MDANASCYSIGTLVKYGNLYPFTIDFSGKDAYCLETDRTFGRATVFDRYHMSNRNAIIEAATQLFSRNGFKGASVSELSRMTGAARGTIFHHFKNKEDLFLNVLADVRKTVLGRFRRRLDETRFDSGFAMVEGATTVYLQLAAEMESPFLLLHRHDAYQMARSNPQLKQHLESIYDGLLDIFEQASACGQRDGSLSVRSPRHTAMVLFAAVDGIVRFNTYCLYDAGALVPDLMDACRRLLKNGRETM